jgi:hypothetical protein
MAIQLKATLSQFWNSVQTNLFPWLVEELGPLSEGHRKLITTLEMVRIEECVQYYQGIAAGRPEACRGAIARAYIAKASLNLSTTRQLIDRLKVDKVLRRICGFERISDIPGEWTFSRAFKQFASNQLSERAHAAMIAKYQSERLVGHLSRDSTAIEAREKSIVKDKKAKPVLPKQPRGRPKNGEIRLKKARPNESRIERQLKMTSATEMLIDLPKVCDVGTKVDSKGNKISWRGYKLHIDTADGDIPISCVLTSASTHDSQVAIPLSLISKDRVINCYDLMDSAYDSGLIRWHCHSLGHVALIDFNRRSPKDTRKFKPHEARRYKERSSAERVNSRLKDSFGGRFIRVRGYAKVMMHLMLGIICLTAEQLIACTT